MSVDQHRSFRRELFDNMNWKNVMFDTHSNSNRNIGKLGLVRDTELVALREDEATQVDSCPNYRPQGPQTTFNLQFVSLRSRLPYLQDFVNSEKPSVIY